MKEITFTVTDGEFKVDILFFIYKDGTVEWKYIHPQTGQPCNYPEQTGYGWSSEYKDKYLNFVERVDKWLKDFDVEENDDGKIFEI